MNEQIEPGRPPDSGAAPQTLDVDATKQAHAAEESCTEGVCRPADLANAGAKPETAHADRDATASGATAAPARDAELIYVGDPMCSWCWGFAPVAQALVEQARAAGVPLALVVLDIDFFKRINDRLGHDGGDAVLQRLGAIMQARAGVRGCAARIGGEEFAVLLEGHDAHSARTFAEYVRGEFGGEHEGAVTTLSAGVAEHRPGETLRELMRRADLALYAAKREGRDRVCVAPVS